MIDPQRRDRGREKQQRDHETFGRFRLLAIENQKRESADERRENDEFNEARVFETAQELVARPTTALLFRSETAFQ